MDSIPTVLKKAENQYLLINSRKIHLFIPMYVSRIQEFLKEGKKKKLEASLCRSVSSLVQGPC